MRLHIVYLNTIIALCILLNTLHLCGGISYENSKERYIPTVGHIKNV